MKKFLLATAFAASLAFGVPAATEAKTVVKVFFGYPHYSYNMGPGYVYRRGYGWYNPGYRRANRNRLSCGEARSRVRNRGYNNVSAIECNGATFTFRGSRSGHRYRLFVNSRSGAIWRG